MLTSEKGVEYEHTDDDNSDILVLCYRPIVTQWGDASAQRFFSCGDLADLITCMSPDYNRYRLESGPDGALFTFFYCYFYDRIGQKNYSTRCMRRTLRLRRHTAHTYSTCTVWYYERYHQCGVPLAFTIQAEADQTTNGN